MHGKVTVLPFLPPGQRAPSHMPCRLARSSEPLYWMITTQTKNKKWKLHCSWLLIVCVNMAHINLPCVRHSLHLPYAPPLLTDSQTQFENQSNTLLARQERRTDLCGKEWGRWGSMQPKVGDQTQYVGLDYAIVSSLISIKHMMKWQDSLLISGRESCITFRVPKVKIKYRTTGCFYFFIYIYFSFPLVRCHFKNNPTKKCYCAERMSASYNRLLNEVVWQTFRQAIIWIICHCFLCMCVSLEKAQCKVGWRQALMERCGTSLGACSTVRLVSSLHTAIIRDWSTCAGKVTREPSFRQQHTW